MIRIGAKRIGRGLHAGEECQAALRTARLWARVADAADPENARNEAFDEFAEEASSARAPASDAPNGADR